MYTLKKKLKTHATAVVDFLAFLHIFFLFFVVVVVKLNSLPQVLLLARVLYLSELEK